jgi:hypothetical protein
VRRAPDFIGVGAQKAATSWLFACLEEHPATCLPTKELHFFSRDQNWQRGRDWYEGQFGACGPGTTTGEYSTSYLANSEAARRIAHWYPDVRIVASLRNPVDRAFSNYRNDLMAGAIAVGTSFEEAVATHPEYVEQGRYATQLGRYLEWFSRDSIHVIVYDDVVDDARTVIKDLFRFLSLDAEFVPPSLLRVVNASRVPRSVAADQAMNRAAARLRRTPLAPAVRWARRKGLAGRVRRWNSRGSEAADGGEATDDIRERFAAALAPEVAALSEMLGRDLRQWSR